MSYPHQPGSPNFDGGDAYEAYLDEQERAMSLDFAPDYCAHCNNTGYIDCWCGGDLCICENNGEEPCPFCDRAGGDFFCDEIGDGEHLT